jgi:hypothetical protein
MDNIQKVAFGLQPQHKLQRLYGNYSPLVFWRNPWCVTSRNKNKKRERKKGNKTKLNNNQNNLFACSLRTINRVHRR